MKLSVYVLGREIATLESIGDFRSELSYNAQASANDLVSLTMPVRVNSYLWEDVLHPVFQMNLPEGFLLQVLQEQFGPHVSGHPLALLAVVGRNMLGRLQVAAPGAVLNEQPKAVEVADILRGDNSEEAFAELVRQHATSGVSGVVPKFLDAQEEAPGLGPHRKSTFVTHRHIIKGASDKLPYVTLNEYLCMQVAARVMPAAKAQLSDDARALVVDRFDVDEQGQAYFGMEDFCSLLGLRPAAKYDTTWERIARAVRDHVPGPRQLETFRGLAYTLLLTFALRNADCHAKNLALLYTSREDAHLSPVYDMVTTCAYAGYQHNPPGISFMGRKTWTPGKSLGQFLTATFGIAPREQVKMVEAISDAVADTARDVRDAMARYPGFRDLGKHMLIAWREGVDGLRNRRVYAMPEWRPGEAFVGFPAPTKLPTNRNVVGRSQGLAKRSRS
jgi:serine/threonine-protein kinase HipA